MRGFFLCFILFAFSINSFAQEISPFYEDGNLYLKFKPGSVLFTNSDKDDSLLVAQNLSEFTSRFSVKKINRQFSFAKHPGLENIVKISLRNPAQIDEALKFLSAQKQLEYAEKVPLKRFYSTPPNDTDYNISQQWNLFKVNAQLAWSYVSPGSDIKIAIVDDGMDITHPDLGANVWVNPGEIPGNGIDDDGNFFIDDINGWDFGQDDNDPNPQSPTWEHGTHVSGIACAVTNNTTGIASIGYNSRLMPVKATNSNLYVSNGYEAIVYAADNGADVINLSWGGPAFSFTEQNVLYYAHNLKCFIVSASGNDGNSNVNYPAGYDYVMSVAATGPNDVITFNSNRGPWIDISAPGINIYSTKPGGLYGLLTGTSMACPMVAGLAALMKSFNPLLTPDQIEHCIKSTADNINFMNPFLIGQMGGGRINAYQAMSCVSATRNEIDMAIDSLVDPSKYTCSGNIVPQLKIRNAGTDTVTTFKLTYGIDNQAYQSMIVNVNLPYDSAYILSLPQVSLGSGNHTLTAFVSWPNGIIDWNLFNDTIVETFSVLTSGLPVPFTENFSDTSNSRDLWKVWNNDGLYGWEIVDISLQGNPEQTAFINLYNDQSIGQRDGLISPSFNFSGLDSVWMSFDAAYQKNFSRPFDSLLVLVSTDCGNTFPFRALSLPGNGQEWPTSSDTAAVYFQANQLNQWCDSLNTQYGCYLVDLTQFAGNDNIVIQFQTFNKYGNNVYLDNINLNGVATTTSAPTVSFSADDLEICPGTMVSFSYTGSSATAFQWTFPGGVPSVSNLQNVSVVYPASGNFSVSLQAFNGSSSNTSNQTNYITVNPLPNVQIFSGLNDSLLCLGDTMIITASGAGGLIWNSTGLFPEIQQNSVTVPGNAAGNYSVWVVGTSADGCVGSDSVNIEITSCLGIPEANGSAVNIFVGDNRLILELGIENSSLVNMKLVGVNGALVMEDTFMASPGKNSRNIPEYVSSGVYVVKVTLKDGQSYHQKLVITR